MPFSGCEKCGTAVNNHQVPSVTVNGSRCRPCPECGRPMHPVSIAEALELVRARAEADQWRAATTAGDGHAEQPSTTADRADWRSRLAAGTRPLGLSGR